MAEELNLEKVNDSAHKRYNILTGEWILVSPHRTKRPWQGKVEDPYVPESVDYDPKCYLCPGNERAGGHTNDNYESTFVFTNDFAALVPEVPYDAGDMETGLLKLKTEKGICRVICFSPNHSLTLPLMELDAIENVVKLWKEQYEELGAIDFINYVQIFENKGQIMGCSNPHPHGQIWASRGIPDEPAKESAKQKAHHEKTGRSLLGDYLEQELRIGERVIVENAHFVALVPFWAVWPYEVLIISREHITDISKFNSDQVSAYADILKRVTTRYDNLFSTSFPYSAGIHQAPTDGEEHPEWHFHMHFYPPLLRSATVKKFMVGYEMLGNPQRDFTAEYSAHTLRELSETHYLKQ